MQSKILSRRDLVFVRYELLRSLDTTCLEMHDEWF